MGFSNSDNSDVSVNFTGNCLNESSSGVSEELDFSENISVVVFIGVFDNSELWVISELDDGKLDNSELESSELESSEVVDGKLDNSELESSELDDGKLDNSELESSELDDGKLDNSELESSDVVSLLGNCIDVSVSLSGNCIDVSVSLSGNDVSEIVVAGLDVVV